MEGSKAILTPTLKGVALVKLVEAGLLQRGEDGSVDTAAFEAFWKSFEGNLDAAICNELGPVLGEADRILREEARKKAKGRHNVFQKLRGIVQKGAKEG